MAQRLHFEPRQEATLLYTCHFKIVVAEDHQESALALAELLHDWDHEVVVTPTASGAWQAIACAHDEADDIDWLIADIFLPDDSGWDLMRDLKRRFEIRGIAVSGSAEPQDIERSLACGFDWHLGKPLNPQLLALTLEASVSGRVD